MYNTRLRYFFQVQIQASCETVRPLQSSFLIRNISFFIQKTCAKTGFQRGRIKTGNIKYSSPRDADEVKIICAVVGPAESLFHIRNIPFLFKKIRPDIGFKRGQIKAVDIK